MTSSKSRVDTDIVIIGAGPATLGLLCNAIKTNKFNELVNTGQGVAILDQGLCFGGGSLQEFGINSNTSANGFIKCLYKKVEISLTQQQQANQAAPAAANMSPEQARKLKDMNKGLDEDSSSDEDPAPRTAVDYVALNPFKDLYKQSPLIKMAFEFGPSCMPLSSIGMILNFAGNHLLYYCWQVFKRRLFYPMTKVNYCQLLQSGEILVHATRTECRIVLDDNVGGGGTGTFEVVKLSTSEVTFRSRALVFSQGGQQTLHPQFFNWFPQMQTRQERIILSDYFIRRQNFLKVAARIQEENLKNIVIVGGSHSGFSSAWMLLNGPADILHNTHVKPTVQYEVNDRKMDFQFPGALFKTQEECSKCCTCKQRSPAKKCTCVCKCFSFFKYDQMDYDYDQLPFFSEGNIKILYRDQIKVFYPRVREAEAQGYDEYNPRVFSNKNGYLYSFTGLRGDAKKLYKSIKSGAEKRVELIKCETPKDQEEYINNADLVIWAIGYQTNEVPLKDTDGKIVNLYAKSPFTQYDVDSRCRLVTADNNILTKTYGSGLAFPMRTNDGMMISNSGRPNPRADSFALYMNFVAKQMLSNLLPKTRNENKVHKISRQPKNKKLNSPTQQQPALMAPPVASQQNPTSAVTKSPFRILAPIRQTSVVNTCVKATHFRETESATAPVSHQRSVSQGLAQRPVPPATAFPVAVKVQPNPLYAGIQSNYGQGYVPKKTEEEAAAYERKKTSWIPSHKMEPPTNRLPRDTNKVIEQRKEREAAAVVQQQSTLQSPSKTQKKIRNQETEDLSMSIVVPPTEEIYAATISQLPQTKTLWSPQSASNQTAREQKQYMDEKANTILVSRPATRPTTSNQSGKRSTTKSVLRTHNFNKKVKEISKLVSSGQHQVFDEPPKSPKRDQRDHLASTTNVAPYPMERTPIYEARKAKILNYHTPQKQFSKGLQESSLRKGFLRERIIGNHAPLQVTNFQQPVAQQNVVPCKIFQIPFQVTDSKQQQSNEAMWSSTRNSTNNQFVNYGLMYVTPATMVAQTNLFTSPTNQYIYGSPQKPTSSHTKMAGLGQMKAITKQGKPTALALPLQASASMKVRSSQQIA